MNHANIRFALITALLAAPFLFGAKGGCGGEVAIGIVDAGPAAEAGACPDGTGTCSGSVDGGPPITCEPADCGAIPEIASYTCPDGTPGGFTNRCLRNSKGTCSWEIRACTPEPSTCKVTGCSSEICADTDVASECSWREEYACFAKYGICQRDGDGKCGWVETKELTSCLSTPQTPRVCGGFAGTPCDAAEYCHYELADMCGYADATGICRPKPLGCTKEYAPVCGCDNQTYGNACMANAAGVSVYKTGECPK